MLALINALLPLVSNLAPVVAHLIGQIKAQSGKTSDQILDEASANLDESGKALLAEQIRLQDKISSGGSVRLSLLLVSTLVLALLFSFAGCKTSKVNTDPYAGAAKTADDISLSIKLLSDTEHNLEVQGLITPQEGLVIVNGLVAIHDADVGFIADVRNAKSLDPSSASKLLIPSLERIKQAVADLNAKGVLGLKSEKAKATFQTALNVVNVSIATIQTLLESKAASQ
jgi:hypothetical protein